MEPGKQPGGVLHQTTMDVARRQASAYRTVTTNLAGTKRSGPEDLVQDSGRPLVSAHSAFTKAASLLGGKQVRLTPSPIVQLDLHAKELPSEYSQRKAIGATPSVSVDSTLSLSHKAYGLSPVLVANFANLGIKNIYPWQKNCLSGPGLLAGSKNLVYSAPTGGGKSLVADGKR